MPTILFVCTANICRSPVAQALFADWVRRQDLPGDWQVLSAGTWAEPGAEAANYAREVLGEQGLNLAAHRAQVVDKALMARADLVLCMTRSHLEALRAEFPQRARSVALLSNMVGGSYDVADPYGGPRRGYVTMVNELRDLIEQGGARIVAVATSVATDGASPKADEADMQRGS